VDGVGFSEVRRVVSVSFEVRDKDFIAFRRSLCSIVMFVQVKN
jgi:hypothetical protein